MRGEPVARPPWPNGSSRNWWPPEPGLTNREIAQKLLVGARAVEFHLGNVYGKLGISSRQELGARLSDEPGPGAS